MRRLESALGFSSPFPRPVTSTAMSPGGAADWAVAGVTERRVAEDGFLVCFGPRPFI